MTRKGKEGVKTVESYDSNNVENIKIKNSTSAGNKLQNYSQEKQENIETIKSKKTHRGRRRPNKQNNDAPPPDEKLIGTITVAAQKNNTNFHQSNEKSFTRSEQSVKTNCAKNKPDTKQLPSESNANNKHLRTEQRKPAIAIDSLAINNNKSNDSTCPNSLLQDEENDEDMDDCIEYKLRPRSVFLANACNVCKRVESNSEKLKCCMHCGMVSYCCDGHRKQDLNHSAFCNVICDERDDKGHEHIYANAKGLSADEFRRLRIHKLAICENAMRRQLDANEREILLFPRLCINPQCREWRQDRLMNCPECKQVSYCKKQPEHLSIDHLSWCKQFKLFQEIMVRLQKEERTDPELPTKVYANRYILPNNIKNFFKDIDSEAVHDECDTAFLSLIATGPLTVLYGMQKIEMEPLYECFNIHVVGAELQFEADTLNKWECFFLHLLPRLRQLKVVFVGPELNVESLPEDTLGKIRMCNNCEIAHRKVVFEFQCRTLYHDYAKSGKFSKPDVVCAFNPGLHRITGYAGRDTWPDTISAIMQLETPFISTAYTEHEAPLDLKRIKESIKRPVKVLLPPQQNPYASLKPDRNFISEESAPLIFKNFYITIVN